jgi:transcription elongation factor Elf1
VLNRAERRELARSYAKDKRAERCPVCNKKSLFVSIPINEWLCDVRCEVCGNTVIKDCKGLIPMVYVSLSSISQLAEIES